MFEVIIGSCEALYGVLANGTRVAPTRATALVTYVSCSATQLVARACARRHQPRPEGRRRRRQLPARSVLQAERLSAAGASAARARRGYSGAGRVLRPALCGQGPEKYPENRKADARAAAGLPLAGKCPRIAERHRAGGDSVRWRYAFGGRKLAATRVPDRGRRLRYPGRFARRPGKGND